MDIKIIMTIAFFVILISIQYTLNRILLELKHIRRSAEKNTETEIQNANKLWRK